MRPRIILACLLCAAVPVFSAQAQTAAQPAAQAPQPADIEIETLRIRGLVDSVNVGSISLQLSRGVSVHVDLNADTPMFIVSRMEPRELSPGVRLRVRTSTGPQGANVAIDVIAMSGEQPGPAEVEAIPELTFQGALKGQEDANDEKTLVLSDKGADRRVNLAPETAFWRLRPAGLRELKPGMSLSVVIIKNGDGDPIPQRAVFGAPIAGAPLPL